MVNQKAIVSLQGARTGPRSLRVTLVDTDATASTFTDFGAGIAWTADDDYTITAIQGQGTTAPTVATSFQPRINGIDKPAFINGAAVYDPKASMQDRLGVLLGARIRQGSTVSIFGRA